MAIANVVTRGYGPSASIAFIVTRGFTIGAAVEEEVFNRVQTVKFSLSNPQMQILMQEVPRIEFSLSSPTIKIKFSTEFLPEILQEDGFILLKEDGFALLKEQE